MALVLSLTPMAAWAAPGVVTPDGTPTSGVGAATASSVAFAHTTGAGTNRLMLVGVSWNCGTTDRSISSVTFTPSGGGPAQELNLVKKQQASGTNLRYSAIYSLLNPTADTLGTVTVTFSGAVSNGIVAGAADFAGVDQTTPLGTPAGANGSSTSASVTVGPITGNELVFDNVFQGGSSESQTLVTGAGQSQQWNAFSGNTRAASSIEQATGSSVIMNWTAATSSIWAIAAVPINPAPAAVTHQLTMGVSPVGGGTTIPTVGSHTYNENDVIDVSASANPGYTFDHWEGDVADPNAGSTHVTMDADKSATAYFTQDEYTLSTGVVGNGSVAALPDQATYHYGDEVVLTATPDDGWVFTGWSGDLSGGVVSQSITVHGDLNVLAHFEPYARVPLAVDGPASYATGATSASNVSFSHTTGTGPDRLMLAGISWNCGTTDRTISSVTFTPTGGLPMPLSEVITQQAMNASSNTRYSAIYYLEEPPVNTQGTLAVTFSGTVGNGIVAGAINFKGVDQANPLAGAAGAALTSGQAPEVTLSALDGDEIVFDNVFQGATDSGQTLTPGDGQTGLWNEFIGNTRAASSWKQAGADSVTMNWTAGTASVWALCAAAINPLESTDIAGATIAEIPNQTYTGSGIEPVLSVTYDTAVLVKDTDYTVAYSDNVNAGVAGVTITGIGRFAGTKDASFVIEKATPTVDTWPSASSITIGQALSSSTLSGGTHSVPGAFDFANPSVVPASTGVYTAAVVFTPDDSANYSDVNGMVDVQVDSAPIANAETPDITGQPSDIAVTVGHVAHLVVTAHVNQGTLSYKWYSSTTDANTGGTPITGAIAPAYDAPTDAPGITYYYCEVTNTDDAATVNKTATATSDAARVQVDAINVSGASVSPIPNQTYTGTPLTPAVTVTYDAHTLVKDTDYTVAYAGNIHAGTATVTITGI
ncbi:MAG TPA: hypothetical protein VFG89_10350, partial [Coriobacteriia bacterium]|nr:hypothetical protein [Coriobacteriia bacterium]